ncbi:MAG: ATP-binding protein [Eubacteriaceae bacterium]
MKTKETPLFLKFLKSRMKVSFFFILFILIFVVTDALYNLPMEPTLYGCLLVFVLAFFLGSMDYFKFRNKHAHLAQLKMGILNGGESFPIGKDLIEEDYQELVQTLIRENEKRTSEYDNREKDAKDYYTLWAHQIKNPISAMGLLLQNGEEGSKNKILQEQELLKIEQYVEMVLQYIRLDDLSSDLVLKNYSLQKLLNQAIKKFSIIFINRKIALDFKKMETMVITDGKWLVFVLEQILSNALKYTNQGKISIYMDPTKEKTLVIDDTGVGIKPEDINRVFEKGFTGYNGRMDRKSTGIGLYLTSQILEKLAHKITITSELGKGTTVKINLERKPLEIE